MTKKSGAAEIIVALVRHGDYHQLQDVPSAHQPFPLNEKGVEQARLAGREIISFAKEKQWHIVHEMHTSCLLRAWQTGVLIREQLEQHGSQSFAIKQSEALAERSVGSVANLTINDIEGLLDTDPRFDPPPSGWKSDSYYRLPFQGAESLMDSGERVAGYIQQVVDDLLVTGQHGSLAVVVGHGASIRHAAYKLGVLAFDDIAKLSMYHAKPVYLAFTEQAGWRHVAGEWKVRKRDTSFTD